MQLTRVVTLAALLVASAATFARATPQYAARAARACDTCHILPDWDTPRLAERKRNFTCQSCHVDPAGGGMRSTAGRYYGRATLPMIATSPRPTDDWDRNLFGRRDKATPYNDYLPVGPKNAAAAVAYQDSIDDPWAWGTPKGTTHYGPFQGRYGKLNADPMLRIGGDFRSAMLVSKSTLVFPMQVDVGAVLHPVHHATLLMNIGARGQSSGYSDTIDDSHTPYFRELFAMIDELPYQLYAKAGRFVPAYGLKLDDHTNRIRREFELDGSLPDARVTGVEAGFVAGYPFLQASYFGMNSKYQEPDAWNIFDLDSGTGYALNAGYRMEKWGAGASYLARRRPLDEGGDTDSYGLYATLNPWAFSAHLPFVLQGEIDTGTRQRESGYNAKNRVYYGEVDWLAANGLNILFAYDWADPDLDVKDDHSGRYQVGAQVTPYPGVTLDGRLRMMQVATPTGDGTDFFLQLHLWF